MPKAAQMRRSASVLFRLNQDILMVAVVMAVALASASALMAI